MDEPLTGGGHHGLPHLQKKGGKILVLVLKYIVGQADVAGFTDRCNFRKAGLSVDLRRGAVIGQATGILSLHAPVGAETHDADLAAANGEDAHTAHAAVTVKAHKIHGVGVGKAGGHGVVGVEVNDRVQRRECLPHRAVGTVPLAGLGQGAVERHRDPRCVGICDAEALGGEHRPHGMGAGRAYTGLVDGTHRSHVSSSMCFLSLRSRRESSCATGSGMCTWSRSTRSISSTLRP